MKSHFLTTALLGLSLLTAHAGIIGIEQFDYPDGPIANKNGGTFWNYRNIAPVGPSASPSDWDNVTAAPTVSAGRIITHNSSAKREYNGPGEGLPPSDEANGAVNEGNVAKTVYYRVTVTTGATVPDSFGLSSYDFGAERIFFGKRGGSGNFGLEVSGGPGTDGGPPVLPNTTYVLVAKLSFDSDEISLFINPDLNAAESAPSVSATYTGSNWSTAVRLASGGGSPVTWDDLVVATSWDELGTTVTTTTDEDNGNLLGPVSLREAVKYSPAGSLITFSPTVFTGATSTTNTIMLTTGEIALNTSVTLDASALPGGVTITGNGTGRLFNIGASGNVTLVGLTLTGGNVPGGGGGAIYSAGGSALRVVRCTFSGNHANEGGAILNDGTLLAENSTFSGNTGGFGGALQCRNLATLIHCTFSGNNGFFGGAIFNNATTLTVDNSIIADNIAGGGIRDILNQSAALVFANANLVQSVTPTSATTPITGPAPLTGAPLLAPLGNYGGPTQTMPPQVGSPAIDAGANTALSTDQRGFSRVAGPTSDIGAVEYQLFNPVVTTTANSGIGSLRYAFDYSAPDQTVTFASNLNGQTITLSSEIVITRSITIDASSLAGGLTIDGGAGNNRIFTVNSGQTVLLKELTLSGGNGRGGRENNLGGAILNDGGTLTLTQCTLFGNSSVLGGAICNSGPLTLTQCTISGNSAQYGGAIYSYPGTLTLTQCTLSGNSSAYEGGAIFNDAVFNEGTLQLTNTLVAGNTAPIGPDLGNYGSTISATGVNLIGDLSGSGLVAGPSVITGAPLLAPLGNYGGPTRTMPPQMGSPAIDAGAYTALSTDQRGFERVVGPIPDIGAVEYQLFNPVVTTTANSGIGSLRHAIDYSAPDQTVTFAPAVNGQAITLASEIAPETNVTIDAGSLPDGVTLSGGDASRIFTIRKTATLKRLTLTGGNGAGALYEGWGGAIVIAGGGTLALEQCTLAGNTDGGAGGAIFNAGAGMLTLTQCTLSGNGNGSAGGAIYNEGTLQLTHCTLSGNSAYFGGAIYNDFGTLWLTHCTLSGNSVVDEGRGGAIFNNRNEFDDSSGPVALNNCIVAHNTAGSDPNISGSYTLAGANITNSAALLAPLGNYGGPTQTMALLPGSPARNAAAVLSPAITSDQRGFPTVGTPDIGAYEAGSFNSFATWAWETTGGGLTFGSDNENDGASNGLEYATRRDPNASDAQISPTLAPNSPSGHTFQFRYQQAARDLRYIVQRGSDLGPANSWTEIYRYDSSTGQITRNGVTTIEDTTSQLITLTDPATGPRLFWRLVIERVP